MARLEDEHLKAIFPTLSATKRKEYLPHLNLSMARFNIDSELRVGMFLAQLKHESNNLTRWLENLNYSAKRLMEVWPTRFKTLASTEGFAHNPKALANRVYNGRMGNRVGSNDGWNFRGRCPIQATGRGMYEKLTDAFGVEMGVDFVENPDLLLDARYGFMAAAWIFAVEKKCLRHADNRNIVACTEAINGGRVGLSERRRNWERALAVLPDGFHLDSYASLVKHYGSRAEEGVMAPDVADIPVEDNPDVIDLEPVLSPSNSDPLPTLPVTDKNGLEGQETANTGTLDGTDADLASPNVPPSSGAGDNASVADGALSPQFINKERPSLFSRSMSAVLTFFGTMLTGIATYFGGSEVAQTLAQKGGERIIENTDRSDWATFGMVVLYVCAIGGIGLLLFWLGTKAYEKSAERANRLNTEKIRTAASKDLNTVELK